MGVPLYFQTEGGRMTLEKAIDILTGKTGYTIEEFNEAVRLGTAALINLRNQRATGIAVLDYRLLGETEE